MKMPNDEYEKYKKLVSGWSGGKDDLQRVYDEIFYKYEDAHDCLVEIDKQQSKWTMDLH